MPKRARGANGMVRASATPIELAQALPRAVLALGSETKNTVCCAAGRRAYVSAPRADLASAADYDEFLQIVHTWPAELGITPDVLAHDLHPEYISTKVAMRGDIWPGVPRVAVQHHAAHIAACAAAEGVWDECWGMACDGTGYGGDGTLWGGEMLRGSIVNGFTRVARLRPVQLLGGAAAIREPWRLALALAHDAGIAWDKPDAVPDEAWRVVDALCTSSAAPRLYSSSAGRLFDGVSALLGVCRYAEQEAQAAIALEKCAGTAAGEPQYALPWARAADGVVELDWRPLVQQLWADYSAGVPRESLAARFHDTLAAAFVRFCAGHAGPRCIVCSGGVFFNRRFSRIVQSVAEQHGLRCVQPRALPPSDAALSLGQAVLAAFRVSC